MTAPDRFEDRLLEQLRHVVLARPAPDVATHRESRRTRLALAGVGVAAATAVVAIVATSSDVTPRAYAVEPRPDGSVTVEIHSLRDAAGLERSLRAVGVPAVVDYVPADQADCGGSAPGATGGTTEAGGASSGATVHTDDDSRTGARPSLSGPEPGVAATMGEVTAGTDGATFTIDRGEIKPGETVYITTSTGAISSIGIAIADGTPSVASRPSVACPTTGPTP
jgi:hypothetical protein